MSGKVETKEICIERAMEQYMISVQACTTHLVANSNRKGERGRVFVYTGHHGNTWDVCECLCVFGSLLASFPPSIE